MTTLERRSCGLFCRDDVFAKHDPVPMLHPSTAIPPTVIGLLETRRECRNDHQARLLAMSAPPASLIFVNERRRNLGKAPSGVMTTALVVWCSRIHNRTRVHIERGKP
ncbi:MAG TPA: hypothetical protein VII40_09625 [Xanthobacteraceae bacterium]